jgi:hypothetical protein
LEDTGLEFSGFSIVRVAQAGVARYFGAFQAVKESVRGIANDAEVIAWHTRISYRQVPPHESRQTRITEHRSRR